MTELVQVAASPFTGSRGVPRARRGQAYLIQANPSAPGLASGLIKSYCLHKLDLGRDWDIDTINFEGPMYRRLKDTLSGHYAIEGVFMLREMYRRLDEHPPDVIAFSSYSWNIALYSYMARTLRDLFPNALLAIGGMGVFGHEERFLREHPQFDIALSGEGEPAFGALLAELSSGAPEYARVPGLITIQDGVTLKGPSPQLMSNLDDIPSPVVRDYVDILRDASYGVNLMLETSRGCPMPCSFCLMSELPATGRYHSFDYVREELDWVLANGYNVEFTDAIFHTNEARCNRILEYILSNHNGKSRFNFEIFVEILRDDTIALMGDMARRGILRPCQIGLQSIEPQALKFARRPFQRKRFDERIAKFYDATDHYAAIDLIFGLPGDTYQGYLNGIDYVFGKQPFAMLLHHLVIIGGTAQERGVAEHDIRFDANTGLVFKSKDWPRQAMDAAAELSFAGRVVYNIRWWPLRILLFELAGSFSGLLDDIVSHMRSTGSYAPDPDSILRAAVSVLSKRCKSIPEEPRRSHLLSLFDLVESILSVQGAVVPPCENVSAEDDLTSSTWTLNRSSALIQSKYTFAPALFQPERYKAGMLPQHVTEQEWRAVATRIRRDIAVVPGGFVDFLDVSELEWRLLQWAAAGRLSWKDVEFAGTIEDLRPDAYSRSVARLANAGVLSRREAS